jgi:TonB family protein
LAVTVGTNGYPRDINIVHKLDAELDDSAMATVRTWRYEPALRDGKAVDVRIEVRVRFRLYEGSYRKMAELWDRSDQSDAKADWQLSKAYFEGTGVPQDRELGLRFLKRAADWNLPEAQFLMGEHFYKDESGAPDYVSAYMWYALSKRAGGAQGEAMLKVLVPHMSAAQLTEAERRVGYWPESPPQESAKVGDEGVVR